MAESKNNILENALVSRMYYYIIIHKKGGINGYSLAKLVYGKFFHNVVKVYGALNELERVNLITDPKCKSQQ